MRTICLPFRQDFKTGHEPKPQARRKISVSIERTPSSKSDEPFSFRAPFQAIKIKQKPHAALRKPIFPISINSTFSTQK